MPEVSVVVPVYNRIDWAVEAINSALAQTIRDIEVIVIDDGSTEDVSPLMQLLADARVHYQRVNRLGAARARNLGISLARAPYVAFLDADDLFVPTKLERQLIHMQATPSVLISHTSYERVDQHGRAIDVVPSGRFHGNVYPSILTSCPIATPTVMVRRAALTPAMRFEESISIGEDNLFWMRVTKRSALLGMDEPLTRVRIHGDNAAYNLSKLRTGMRLLRRAIVADSDLNLGLFTKQRVRAHYLWIESNCLRREGDRGGGWRLALLSLLHWPFGIRKFREPIGDDLGTWYRDKSRRFEAWKSSAQKEVMTVTDSFLQEARRRWMSVYRCLTFPFRISVTPKSVQADGAATQKHNPIPTIAVDRCGARDQKRQWLDVAHSR